MRRISTPGPKRRRGGCARRGGDNALDYENLAEEVADLGREQLHACESLTMQIIVHLMKLEKSEAEEPPSKWAREIAVFRLDLDKRLSASLRRKVEQNSPQMYRRAAKLTAIAMGDYEPAMGLSFPDACPYSLDDILGRGVDWLPAPLTPPTGG